MKYPENYWYPILDANTKISDKKPFRLKRFNKNLVLWKKQDGSLACMEDRCPHKAAPLSLGKVSNGELTCAYHNFSFNSEGHCTSIPAQGAKFRVPKGFCIKPFALKINFGFIWLWWGNETPSEENHFPNELRKESKHIKAFSTSYPASFHRVMESNGDCYHLNHLHSSVFPSVGSIIDSCHVETKGKTISMATSFKKTEEGLVKMTVVNNINFPNLAWAYMEKSSLRNIIAVSPIDDNTTWFMTRYYSKVFYLPVIGTLLQKLMSVYIRYLVIPPDYEVQAGQVPKDTGLGTDQLVVSADRIVSEYWKMLSAEKQGKRHRLQDPPIGRERIEKEQTH